MKKLLCALAVSALTLLGADVTGKWTGTFEMNRDGEARSRPALMILKQEGTMITGSIGPSADEQHPIKSGTIADDRITLHIEPQQGPTKVTVELKLDGDDHLAGQATGETDEGKFTAKIDVKREK